MPDDKKGSFVLVFTGLLERIDALEWGPNEATIQFRVNNILEAGLNRAESIQKAKAQ